MNCVGGEVSGGDTAWLLCATTFVMLQTPAAGLAQAGLVRNRNALSVIAQSLVGVAVGSALWFIIGYSMTFGPSYGGFIGSGYYAFFVNIPINDCFPEAPTIPALLFASYQMMFALMVPVIITGAWAEKMRYYPLAHWIWNMNGWLNLLGARDFAGGITIHTSSGIAALAVSIVQAARKRHTELTSTAHILFETVKYIPLMVIGAFLVWGGWYSFNGGSALAANFQAVTALLNTQISACVSVCVWVLLDFRTSKKFSVPVIISGALAGLAGVTPGSGFIRPYH